MRSGPSTSEKNEMSKKNPGQDPKSSPERGSSRSDTPRNSAPRSPRNWLWIGAVVLLGSVAFAVVSSRDGAAPVSPKSWRARIVQSFPHDPDGFCQGLVYHEGSLFEGTGEYGSSTLRKVELETGRPLKLVPLDDAYFGEGITRFGDEIFQLTWKEHKVLVYQETERGFSPPRFLDYPFQGWGLTHDGVQLIASDGTDTLRFLSPQDLSVLSELKVKDGPTPVSSLNELEYVEGEIFANVWKKELIVRISPETGKVLGWIDCRHLLREFPWSSKIDVFNGIAYDPGAQRLFVTGKNWPKLFEIELVPR